MNNYIITVYGKEEFNAGPKATRDVENILMSSGTFKTVDFYFELNNSIKSKIKKIKYRYWDIPRKLKELKANSVIIQYPVYSSIISDEIRKRISKSTKVYYFIHDIESLRLFKDSKSFKSEEIDRLNNSDGIISHNKKMTEWLLNNGINVPIVNLEIFDYLTNKTALEKKLYDKSVCFAGNLMKAKFLENIPRNLKLNLYGPNPNEKYPENVSYKGIYKPEELPAYLEGNFGLIWDGASSDKCDGMYGEYMKYNNPHKVSLYIASGIPVIIWKKAALADFIEKNKLGIVVENLYEINGKLNEITEKDYEEYKKNAVMMGKKLRQGIFTKKAVEKMIEVGSGESD